MNFEETCVQVANRHMEQHMNGLGTPQSPIEWTMLAALAGSLADPRTFRIHCQHKIGKYSADFMITGECSGEQIKVVVECDGHDFHEKTKAQAARDKKRDREIQTAGYKVLRFTGSEIFSDPIDCADSVYDLFVNEAHAIYARERKAAAIPLSEKMKAQYQEAMRD